MAEDTQNQDEPIQNGLQCFINSDRECGADCMAYSTYASESPYLNEQQKNCTLIVGIERLGRYAGGVMKVLKDRQQDAERGGAKIPDPLGGMK